MRAKIILPALSRDAATQPLLDVTTRPVFIPDFETPRFRLTPKHFAYLKLPKAATIRAASASFPGLRGSHRSRTQADIVKEAKALIADGVKEINLIRRTSTYYGLDLRPNQLARDFIARKIQRRRRIAFRRRDDGLFAVA